MRLAVAVLGAVFVVPGSHAVGQDAGSVGVPIDVVILVEEGAIAVHQTVDLVLNVTAEADLEQIRVRASAVGNVEIVRPLDASMPELLEGESAVFGIAVRYGEPGESSVHFDVDAVITKVNFRFGDRATLNAVVRTDRAFAGPDALVNLRREAAQYDGVVRRMRWVVILAVVGLVLAAVVGWLALRQRGPPSGA